MLGPEGIKFDVDVKLTGCAGEKEYVESLRGLSQWLRIWQKGYNMNKHEVISLVGKIER